MAVHMSLLHNVYYQTAISINISDGSKQFQTLENPYEPLQGKKYCPESISFASKAYLW